MYINKMFKFVGLTSTTVRICGRYAGTGIELTDGLRHALRAYRTIRNVVFEGFYVCSDNR